MPLISVIIPVSNGEKTIRETIASALNQSFVNLEIIVVKDESQDLTLNSIPSIQDPRLKIFSYLNAGVANTRDRPVTHASGEFIAFLDADDLRTPDKLKAQLKALQANPQAAVAYSWVDYIDRAAKFLGNGNHVTASRNIYDKLLAHILLLVCAFRVKKTFNCAI